MVCSFPLDRTRDKIKRGTLDRYYKEVHVICHLKQLTYRFFTTPTATTTNVDFEYIVDDVWFVTRFTKSYELSLRHFIHEKNRSQLCLLNRFYDLIMDLSL